MLKYCLYFSLFLLVYGQKILNTTNMPDKTFPNCVKNIFKTFEAQEVLIFFFNDDDFPVKIVKESWTPVVLMNLHETFRLKKYFQVDFYLTVISSASAFESLLARINRKFHPRTKFVIIYSGEHGIEGVFRICQRNRITNVVLIHGTDILTYFPYGEGDCGDNTQPQLVGRCTDGSRVDGIFPDKAPLLFNGCSLRILALHMAPYVINETDDTNPGFDVAIAREALSRMQLSVRYVRHSEQSFGHKSPQDEYTGTYQLMFSGEADLLLGNLRMNSSFLTDFSFTQPHATDQVTWHVRASGPADRRRSLRIIFAGRLWAALLGGWALTAGAWALLAQRADRYSSLPACLLVSLSVLLQGSVRQPRSRALRLAFIAWTWGALLLATAYQSQLISLLTHTLYEPQVADEEAMLDAGYEFGFYHSLRDLFNEQDPLHWRIYTGYSHCPLIDLDCIERAAHDAKFAVLKNRRQIRFLTARYLFPDGRRRLYTFEQDVFYYPLTMMMAKDHAMLARFNSLILRMQENGLISRLDHNLSGYREPVVEQSPTLLSVDHLKGAFYIFFIGNSSAVVTFILECILKYITHICCSKCIK